MQCIIYQRIKPLHSDRIHQTTRLKKIFRRNLKETLESGTCSERKTNLGTRVRRIKSRSTNTVGQRSVDSVNEAKDDRCATETTSGHPPRQRKMEQYIKVQAENSLNRSRCVKTIPSREKGIKTLVVNHRTSRVVLETVNENCILKQYHELEGCIRHYGV